MLSHLFTSYHAWNTHKLRKSPENKNYAFNLTALGKQKSEKFYPNSIFWCRNSKSPVTISKVLKYFRVNHWANKCFVERTIFLFVPSTAYLQKNMNIRWCLFDLEIVKVLSFKTKVLFSKGKDFFRKNMVQCFFVNFKQLTFVAKNSILDFAVVLGNTSDRNSFSLFYIMKA